jgi:hypothetical protein
LQTQSQDKHLLQTSTSEENQVVGDNTNNGGKNKECHADTSPSSVVEADIQGTNHGSTGSP